MIKKTIKKIIPAETRRMLRQKQALLRWICKGMPVPYPSPIKRRIIKKIAKENSLHIFVETGTAGGETVDAMEPIVRKIFTIEVDDALFELAKNKYKDKKNITVMHGDSGELLPELLDKLHEPALFWLDGHYSGDGTSKGILNTPVIKELEAIFKHSIKNHVILIDDARCFTGNDDYPTLEELNVYIHGKNPELIVQVKKDIIFVLPKSRKI